MAGSAEGATAPESLRRTDRRVRQRWKAVLGTSPRLAEGESPVGRCPGGRLKLSGADDSGGEPSTTRTGELEMTKPLASSPAADDFVAAPRRPRRRRAALHARHPRRRRLDAFLDETLPDRSVTTTLDLPAAAQRPEVLAALRRLAAENRPRTSLIGMGYYPTVTPGVIQRNVLENPAWYTAYTPYQPEISQGRLEALLNFQTTITELTGLEVANASLLDEATAAAEAMSMARRLSKSPSPRFFVHHDTHPQTIAVLAGPSRSVSSSSSATSTARRRLLRSVVQLPDVDRRDRRLARARSPPCTTTAASSSSPPTCWRARCSLPRRARRRHRRRLGPALRRADGLRRPARRLHQRPRAAARAMPGRIVGVSTDTAGRPALRLALQTREQHIRREKPRRTSVRPRSCSPTSPGCTPAGTVPRACAGSHRVHALAASLSRRCGRGLDVRHESCFDTVTVDGVDADAVLAAAPARASTSAESPTTPWGSASTRRRPPTWSTTSSPLRRRHRADSATTRGCSRRDCSARTGDS